MWCEVVPGSCINGLEHCLLIKSFKYLRIFHLGSQTNLIEKKYVLGFGTQSLDIYLRSNSQKIDGGRWMCSLCDKITSHAGNMKQHFITHHYRDESDTSCSYCGRTFKNKNSLASHVSQSHKGLRQQYEYV